MKTLMDGIVLGVRHALKVRAMLGALGLLGSLMAVHAYAGSAAATPARDGRIEVIAYDDAEIYRLRGYIGYQIDLQFEPGEVFVGLGAGDIEGISFAAQDNHLFLKPKAAAVETNLTVLTSRRQYQFDYAAGHRPESALADAVYAVRFVYPSVAAGGRAVDARAKQEARIDADLGRAAAVRHRNDDYWYCGSPSLRPVAAFDDGVHTRLRFGARNDLPALFVRNEDGSESLLNFSMDAGDVVIHRVARGFTLRRGALRGCIVNKGFIGGGDRLESGTVAPDVERATPGARP